MHDKQFSDRKRKNLAMVFGYEVFFKLKNLSKFSPATLLVSPMSRFLPLFQYRDIVYRRETFSHEKKKIEIRTECLAK